MAVCIYCKTEADTRPYGPDGGEVCVNCARATPERDAECGGRYRALLKAAGAADFDGVAALTSRGPVALDSLDGDLTDVQAVINTKELAL